MVAQSGRTLSVVTTVEAFADIEVVRLLLVFGFGNRPGLVAEFNEEDEDIADEKVPRPWLAYARPLRNGGGSYVTPNSGCWQYGQQAGSETSDSGSAAVSTGGGVGFDGSS